MIKHSVRSTVLCAFFAALLAVSALIVLPTPAGIPLTLQIPVLAFIGFLLPPSSACKSTLVYLLCGAAGLPVFASMQGGFSVLLGPTGGYLWGFLPFVLLCSLPLRIGVLRFLCAVGGLLLCHLAGAVQAAFVGNTPLQASLLTLSLPLFFKDLVLLAAARALAVPCRRAFVRFSFFPSEKKE